MAKGGQTTGKSPDIVKNPITLEFLGLKPDVVYPESKLENAIINKMQQFLLELDKGFLSEARQKRFTSDEQHFLVDLVFYNRLLQRYVLIDLEIDKLTHQDLGQMQMYVNCYDRYAKQDFERPAIGTLLCKEKSDALVELTLPKDANIYASVYQLYLPDKALSQTKMKEWVGELEENEELKKLEENKQYLCSQNCTSTDGNTTMDTKALRQKIPDLAIRGKLVPQDPNDGPAPVLFEQIKTEEERLIKEGKIKRSRKSAKTSDTLHYEDVPFEAPDNWVWMALGEVGTWQSGGTPSCSNKTYYGGNISWLKTGDLNDGLISDIPESITEEAIINSFVRINPAGSVLTAMYSATIGKLGILTLPATTNQACYACIELNVITQLYLFYFLLSQRNGPIAKGGGGVQPNISKEIIVNTFISLPPLSE